jgi:hypothetical protein
MYLLIPIENRCYCLILYRIRGNFILVYVDSFLLPLLVALVGIINIRASISLVGGHENNY